MADQVLEDPKGSDLGFVALGLRGQPSLPGTTGLALGGMNKMGPEQAKKCRMWWTIGEKKGIYNWFDHSKYLGFKYQRLGFGQTMPDKN